MQLKVASYNIRKAIGLDRKRDPERIISVLREVDADIIAIQEVDRRVGARASTIPRALLDDTHWRALPVAVLPQSLGWHGNALLVRRDIDLVDCEPLALPTFEPRGAVSARLRLGTCEFFVIGAHLDLSGLRRRDQIRAILKHVEAQNGMPTVVLGDFNQWGHRTGAMREFGGTWQKLIPGLSFPALRPIAALDRIVVSEEWHCGDQSVHHSALATRASDHLPVVATLRLPD